MRNSGRYRSSRQPANTREHGLCYQSKGRARAVDARLGVAWRSLEIGAASDREAARGRGGSGPPRVALPRVLASAPEVVCRYARVCTNVSRHRRFQRLSVITGIPHSRPSASTCCCRRLLSVRPHHHEQRRDVQSLPERARRRWRHPVPTIGAAEAEAPDIGAQTGRQTVGLAGVDPGPEQRPATARRPAGFR